MKTSNTSHYFFSFIRVTLPSFGLLFGLTWSFIFARTMGLLPGIPIAVSLAVASALGMAWYLSGQASRRKPLSSLQEAKGLKSWSYVDIDAQCKEVSEVCADLLRSLCIPGTVLEYGINGVLVGETKSTLWTWGSELLVQVECLGLTTTRVQVLSRPLVPVNIIDFGSNKRLVDKLLGRLRARYGGVAER